jgi:hypothetical protein
MSNLTKVKQLLDEAAARIPSSLKVPIITDYSSLKEAVILQEYQQELRFLSEALHEGLTFEESFKQRCIERALNNEGTCLSFYAMPSGDCNTLYWSIAFALFEPQTMGEILNIVCPQIKYCLNIRELELQDNVKSRRRMQSFFKEHAFAPFELEKQDIQQLKGSAQLEHLPNFVIRDEYLLDLRQVNQFSFDAYRSLYKSLQKYPRLAEKVSQHNHAFKTLDVTIRQIEGSGFTPYEAIMHLIKALRLGGETVTGQMYASLNAQVAYTDFKNYWKSLPNPTQNALEWLADEHGNTLSDVFKRLDKENCVEGAAKDLNKIVNYGANKTQLNIHIKVDKATLAQLKNTCSQQISVIGHDETLKLPLDLSRKNLSSIAINNLEEFSLALVNFMPEFYAELLRCVKDDSTRHQYIKYLLSENTILNNEQRKVFLEGVAKHYPQLGLHVALLLSLSDNLLIFIESLKKNFTIIELLEVLTYDRYSYSEFDSEFDFVKHRYKNRSIMNVAASYPERLKEILSLFPEQKDKLSIIQWGFMEGKSVLHEVANNPQCLSVCLNLYNSSKDLFNAITKRVDQGLSVLHKAAGNHECLKLILNRFERDVDKLNFIRWVDEKGNTALSYAVEKGDFLSIEVCLSVFSNYDDKIKAILHGDTLHRVSKIRSSNLQFLLSQFSNDNERMLALHTPSSQYSTLWEKAHKENYILFGIIHTFSAVQCISPEWLEWFQKHYTSERFNHKLLKMCEGSLTVSEAYWLYLQSGRKIFTSALSEKMDRVIPILEDRESALDVETLLNKINYSTIVELDENLGLWEDEYQALPKYSLDGRYLCDIL